MSVAMARPINTARGRKGFQRRERMVANDIGPTPETAAKLQADALLVLRESGRITIDHERAGREINHIWEALERAMSPSGGVLLGASGGGNAREPPDGMSYQMAHKLRWRHQPWASREIEKFVAPGLTRYGIVWRLVNLNWPIAHIARTSGVTTAIALTALRDSFDVFIEIADKDGGL